MPQTTSQVFTGNVVAAPAPLAVTTAAALPDATNGTAYDQQIAVTGGTPPYTFAVSAGAFPVGISMDASGHITGTATVSGAYSVTVQITDSGA